VKRLIGALSALVLGWIGTSAAQGTCLPDPAPNEAKTMAIFAVPLAFSPGSAPDLLPASRPGSSSPTS
jgi:hypothetical protein